MPLEYTKFKKDKEMKKAILSAAVLFALSGCSYLSLEKGTDISQATMEQIVVNKSSGTAKFGIMSFPRSDIWGTKTRKPFLNLTKKASSSKNTKPAEIAKIPLTGK